MPAKRAHTFIALGGHAALDLLNTRPMGENGLDERLADFAALKAWCVQFGVVSPETARGLGGRAGAGAAASVRGLREALRAALQKRTRAAFRALAEAVNVELARSPLMQRLEEGRGLFDLSTLRAMRVPADLSAAIAAEVAGFVASPELEHARSCAANDCVLWFIDRTRNHSRRWCQMEGCGARAKARTYYQRRKAGRR